MENKTTLGQKIRKYRTRQGLSQLALENEIKASPGSISRIESGKINPSKETLLKLVAVLDLKFYEILYLLGIDQSEMTNFVSSTGGVFSTLDLDEVLQNSVNSIPSNLDILSAVILLVEGDRLYAKTFTEQWYTNAIMNLLHTPFNKLSISLKSHPDNICAKAINEDRPILTEDLFEATKYAIPEIASRGISKIIKFKSGLSIPIRSINGHIGSIFFTKDYEDNFESELKVLDAFAEQISSAISNAQKYEKLKLELEILKNDK